jgi:hypothetical protein
MAGVSTTTGGMPTEEEVEAQRQRHAEATKRKRDAREARVLAIKRRNART